MIIFKVLWKEQGAQLVVARANRDVHAKFLLRNGADHVIYPEKQMAIRAAVRYGADNVYDYIQLTKEYSIYETPTPAAWVGKTIIDLQVRQRYHINILAVKKDDLLEPLPPADHTFRENESLLILGSNGNIEKFLHF